MSQQQKIKVGAVSYLNTVPLVWGMLHGEQNRSVTLSFSIPSLCADHVGSGIVDVGLVPVAEIARQGLTIVSDVGIASQGPVRSILLVSRVPVRNIRTLAVDASSRTSVELAKIVLRERYGVAPQLRKQEPDLDAMLSGSDAALVIGDPALRIDPEKLPFECLDLGAEWKMLTSLPMVFAAWAGKNDAAQGQFHAVARASYAFGHEHLSQIVEAEYHIRGVSKALASTYFERHIHFELGNHEMRGLEAFFEMADLLPVESLSL